MKVENYVIEFNKTLFNLIFIVYTEDSDQFLHVIKILT